MIVWLGMGLSDSGAILVLPYWLTFPIIPFYTGIYKCVLIELIVHIEAKTSQKKNTFVITISIFICI